MAQTPEQMAAAMVANMKEKTGKTLEAWLKIVARSKLEKHGAIVKQLKAEHGMTHGYANMVAHAHLNPASVGGSGDAGGGADLVAAQYAGPKEELRPIYDALLKQVQRFGKDVEVAPKKAYVSLRRGKQFAIVQPSTRTRVDVGINLKGKAPKGRLEASGSFNAMVSHRVRLESPKDVDRELVGWLKEAYEAGV